MQVFAFILSAVGSIGSGGLIVAAFTRKIPARVFNAGMAAAQAPALAAALINDNAVLTGFHAVLLPLFLAAWKLMPPGVTALGRPLPKPAADPALDARRTIDDLECELGIGGHRPQPGKPCGHYITSGREIAYRWPDSAADVLPEAEYMITKGADGKPVIIREIHRPAS